MFGLYLLENDTLADNHTVVDHKKANSFSNELYKGVMDGTSKGVFNGKIYVRPNAQKTNAFQANRNILLTDKATINTKPQLKMTVVMLNARTAARPDNWMKRQCLFPNPGNG